MPDSRSYKDVKSARYIGRIESSEGLISHVQLARDGLMWLAVGSRVYQVRFDALGETLSLQ